MYDGKYDMLINQNDSAAPSMLGSHNEFLLWPNGTMFKIKLNMNSFASVFVSYASTDNTVLLCLQNNNTFLQSCVKQ